MPRTAPAAPAAGARLRRAAPATARAGCHSSSSRSRTTAITRSCTSSTPPPASITTTRSAAVEDDLLVGLGDPPLQLQPLGLEAIAASGPRQADLGVDPQEQGQVRPEALGRRVRQGDRLRTAEAAPAALVGDAGVREAVGDDVRASLPGAGRITRSIRSARAAQKSSSSASGSSASAGSASSSRIRSAASVPPGSRTSSVSGPSASASRPPGCSCPTRRCPRAR